MGKDRFQFKRRLLLHSFVIILFILISCILGLKLFNLLFNVETFQNITFQSKDNEMVVYSFSDLNEALTSDTITSIYLGADITLESGIVINPAKEYLIISGINPYDNENTIHTLTEYDGLLMYQTIVLKSNINLKSIILCNIIIYGSNYYGTICIDDAAKDIVITYDNLEYYGPQLAYNRYGTVVFNDVIIQIGKFGRKSPAQEVGEVGNVILKGNIDISQVESQINEIFYFMLQPGRIEIASDAVVNISTYDLSGFVYSVYNVDFIARYGSQFYFNSSYHFCELTGAFNNFTVEDYAIVHINITGTKDKEVLLVNGSLNVGEGAELHLVSNKGAFPALRVKNGAVFNNPGSVLFYSPTFRPISYLEGKALDIKSQQLNYWKVAGQGGINDIPLYSWKKADQSIFTLKGTVSLGDTGTFSLTSTNYSSDDTSATVLPNGTNFNLNTARVIALGRLEINGEYEFLSDSSSRINGSTKAFTEIYLSYEDNEGILVSLNTIADKNGRFSFVFDDLLLNDTVVYLQGFYQYLQCETSIVVKEKNLQFESIPNIMFFPTSKISPYPVIIKRKKKNWSIVVYNSLGAGTKWRLTADIAPHEVNDSRIPLPDGALIFINESNQVEKLSTDREVVIMEHTALEDVEFVPVVWEEDKGILLYIEPGTVLKDVIYTAIIKWSLINAP